MRIQACLNGARPPDFHPALPLTPDELARDAAACVAAGAIALHLHPRGAELYESLEPRVIEASMRAVRAAAPGIPISVSTAAWIAADDALRRRQVVAWAGLGTARPDEASVNLCEDDAPAVIEALLASGIGVEAGLSSLEDADRLIALGIAPRCRRFLVEIPEEEGPDLAEAILKRLDGIAPGVERQIHGEDASAWPLFRLAVERGAMARLGLEDIGLLPDGSPADGNASLLAAGLALAREAED
ncbi:3-keto-5-aminohexanoate cleavage protein [Roseomonas chloroacetimidivorans]|uniref:3-keto-5-aminohexanoate cleavage protein n=1 Tax=Roseomonas chloroacetimidivorans TaxID=1766656 RepID=UPI003C73C12D